MAPQYYDELEISDPDVRERAQFASLAETVKRATAAPGWARQLGGLDQAARRGLPGAGWRLAKRRHGHRR